MYTAPFRSKASTLLPVLPSRDSGLSEGSSGGASDEERRRSGSSDHYLSGGQSPEHPMHGRESLVYIYIYISVGVGVGAISLVVFTCFIVQYGKDTFT